MDEKLQDFELEPSEEPRPRPRTIWPYVAAAILLLVVAVLVVYFLRRPSAQPETLTPTGEPPTAAPPEPEAAAPEVVDLPSLAESDQWMREVVSQLSSHPKLAEWLVTDELVRRFVAAVDNFAEGKTARSHLLFLEPDGEFQAIRRDGRLIIDPRSYGRFDAIAEVVGSLDAQGTAELYRAVRPLLQEAYRDLGYPDRQFDDVLLAALRQLLDTPVLESEVELDPRVSSFSYADPDLEGLSAAQKQLLRMGPVNLVRLQRKAREIAGAIGFEPERLAPAPSGSL